MQPAVRDPQSQIPGDVLQLQRTLGNRAVAQLVAETAPPSPPQSLPHPLKAGIEALSGFSMDDVRVHFNSPHPAGLGALAYTRSTEIHVAPGQESHLPHEAWHVAQQKQGSVGPAVQVAGAMVNDDPALELEADRFGAAASRPMSGFPAIGRPTAVHSAAAGQPAAPVQRKISINGKSAGPGTPLEALKKLALLIHMRLGLKGYPEEHQQAIESLAQSEQDFGSFDLDDEAHRRQLRALISPTAAPSSSSTSTGLHVKTMQGEYEESDKAKNVTYLGEAERQNTRYEVAGGRIVRAVAKDQGLETPPGGPGRQQLVEGIRAGHLVKEQKKLGLDHREEDLIGEFIFVFSPEKEIFAGPQQIDRFHHSSFLSGGAVAAAGSIRAKDGRILTVSNLSGHYKPGPEHLVQFVKHLEDEGVDLSQVIVELNLGAATDFLKAPDFLRQYSGPRT